MDYNSVEHCRRTTMATSMVSDDQVKLSVDALRSVTLKNREGKNALLLGDRDSIWIQVAMKKIPSVSRKPVRIPLPHTLHANGETDICLITKDPQASFVDLLETKGVTGISRVLGITKLKNEHTQYESRRRLCAQYDLFLADARVLHLLPGLLGKEFYKKQKLPVDVDLTQEDLVAEIGLAKDCTRLTWGAGACLSVRAAHMGMTDKEMVENIIVTVASIGDALPGKWGNIQSINLKTSSSIALPIYSFVPEIKEVMASAEAEIDEKKKTSKKVKESVSDATKAKAGKSSKSTAPELHKKTSTVSAQKKKAAIAAVSTPSSSSKKKKQK